MPIIAAATLPPSVRIEEEREGKSGRLFKERRAERRRGADTVQINECDLQQFMDGRTVEFIWRETWNVRLQVVNHIQLRRGWV